MNWNQKSYTEADHPLFFVFNLNFLAREKKLSLGPSLWSCRKMLFSMMVNVAFAFFGPLAAAGIMVGDWMVNAYLAAKVVETVVPNGPAIVGNFTEIFPVLFNTVYSAMEPAIHANYTGFVKESFAQVNFTQLGENVTQVLWDYANSTVSAF